MRGIDLLQNVKKMNSKKQNKMWNTFDSFDVGHVFADNTTNAKMLVSCYEMST